MTLRRMDNVGIVVQSQRFLSPPVVAITGMRVNALGYLRVMFTVDDMEERKIVRGAS